MICTLDPYNLLIISDCNLFILSGSGKTTSKNVEISMCVIGPKGKVIEVICDTVEGL